MPKFYYDDDIKSFNTNGEIKYSPASEMNETWVRVNKISKTLLDELNTYLKSTWSESGEYAPTADIVTRNGGDAIYFDIVWGDWKHDHIRLWYLMYEFFRDRGYTIERDIEVTEEDGTDTYSAEHYYTIQGDDEKSDVKEMHEGDVNDLGESYLDDIKMNKINQIERKAGEACTTMGDLISTLTDDTKAAWGEQISAEDITIMKQASDAAWLLYHYRKDGKVRPIKR